MGKKRVMGKRKRRGDKGEALTLRIREGEKITRKKCQEGNRNGVGGRLEET